MPGEPAKRTRRQEYKQSLQNDGEQNAALPKKKFYRQRAHANPFSDHALT
jgi:tRNA (guanine-N7-)-methyltransferase